MKRLPRNSLLLYMALHRKTDGGASADVLPFFKGLRPMQAQGCNIPQTAKRNTNIRVRPALMQTRTGRAEHLRLR
eukprot:12879958-Alexandrium_andersonii.AAC.1